MDKETEDVEFDPKRAFDRGKRAKRAMLYYEENDLHPDLRVRRNEDGSVVLFTPYGQPIFLTKEEATNLTCFLQGPPPHNAAPFQRLGFHVVDTGGGCRAYRRDLGTLFVLVTGEEGCDLPKQGEAVQVGIYHTQTGATHADHTYQNLTEAVTALEKELWPADRRSSPYQEK